ncbi:MAG TPA: hypothetical protein VD771_05340, partial [Gemmatimonadaceae bacterium]|nr:hypothetical protein [Gemmatimonadaceae bacterium]
MRRVVRLCVLTSLVLVTGIGAQSTQRERSTSTGRRSVVVASKPFGESYLLCEMFAQILESRGFG